MLLGLLDAPLLRHEKRADALVAVVALGDEEDQVVHRGVVREVGRKERLLRFLDVCRSAAQVEDEEAQRRRGAVRRQERREGRAGGEERRPPPPEARRGGTRE